ncbi:MAG: hypothetical protein COU07_03310 [Candidatus Harrisonbacteria bacterium CG10_big_fil_rev_8_21_14_0_10_40_38]|uniref:Uncharacterized protein n=1 Tax=Candidatus Harrisonbacteria bacterium CG10_big_fil_rev_8_21_14_0_10_40_38 TaxID=1974583 RepID=A0A2H0UR48_9BACT|nr:MAG: hypothetical protein COU07_03310 [Candidatus Harrisonbacteria bacterium CG10_big_fil_rev_8_21_14_0_10_40_38]
MKKITPSVIILVGIASLCFILTSIGLSYGIPQKYIGDEYVQVAIALKMLEEKAVTPNFPEIFYHQPLSAYISLFGIGGFLSIEMIFGIFKNLAELRTFYSINSTNLLIVVRLISVLLSTATIFLVYAIGKNLFSKKAGFIAAFFWATSFLSVYIHHSGRVWSYISFFIALSFLWSTKLLHNKSTKTYIKAGIGTVLSAAMLLPGILTIFPTLIAGWNGGKKKLFILGTVVFLGLVLIIAINPRGLGVVFHRFQIFLDSSATQIFTGGIHGNPLPKTPILNRVFDPFKTLFSYDPIYFILAFIGGYLLLKNDKKKFILLSSFPIAFYLFIGPLFAYGWVSRTLIPFMIYIVIFGAYAAVELIKKIKIENNKTLVGIIFLLALPSLTFSVLFDAKLLTKDTRTEAIDWVYKNLPENTKIITFSHTNEVINQNREILEMIEKFAPEKLDTRQRTLLASGDKSYPKPFYAAWDARTIGIDILPEDFFKKENFEYYIKTDWGGSIPNQESLEKTFLSKELIVWFSPFKSLADSYAPERFLNVHNMTNPLSALFSVNHPGPVVEIYKVKF